MTRRGTHRGRDATSAASQEAGPKAEDKSAEEIAKEAEAEREKQRQKAAKAASAAAAKKQALKDPKVQANKWLKGVQDYISKVETATEETSGADKLPNNMGETYKSQFESHMTELKDYRTYLETAHPPKQLKRKLNQANRFINTLKDDLAAWGTLHKSYYKKSCA